jgi:CDP-diacylglycerol--serine O-phosphatidyltransferase
MNKRLDIDDLRPADAPEVELEEDASEEPPPGRRERIRRRFLRSTALLPALFTVSNGLCGFAAIHFATKEAQGLADMWHVQIACWLIFAAMVCDMLDGSVARLTRKTSDFGGQLDSLSDVISFGVAPAIIMSRLVFTVLGQQATVTAVGRTILCVAGLYMACAALRLARFNVENEPDESAHMNFSGLPSPGAAAAVVAPMLLFSYLCLHGLKAAEGEWLSLTVGIALPALTLVTALLMVSRIRYPHVINQYIRGKRSFSYLVKIVVIAPAAMLYPLETCSALAVGYALSGPVAAAWRAVRDRGAKPSGGA